MPSTPVKKSASSRFSATFSPSTSISKLLNAESREKHGQSVEDSEFAAKKWVWLQDDNAAFIKGFVVSEEPNDKLKIRCSDDSDRIVDASTVDKVNPPKFDKANDMAELTFLNEASVVHNLSARYTADSIYTYSGLFLVAVNPYTPLPIYDKDTIQSYKNKSRDETTPHIYATTDLAFRNMLEMHENQSILVTGESGAGKTENTKKVIQYLAAITSESNTKARVGKSNAATFEQQILQANPILEAFGNAQTVRNNNSSRFGKFIRIEFSRSGNIAGASIDWYLLEKSRVIHQNSKERNYHIFYELLSGAPKDLKDALLLDGNANAYTYLKHSNKTITDVDDKEEYQKLLASMKIMGFTTQEQNDVLRVIAAILHIGNIELGAENPDQGRILNAPQVERVCHLLGINADDFSKSLLRPRVKAGRDWVTQSRSAEQVRNALDALSKSLYERVFGQIVNRINQSLERANDNTTFIGVLDIAGFEIFENNSFEQLCINYTNEKLQQFFNHHMFVLEQEEYSRENIEWKFIDFGHDLQPTIDLIEKSNPMGIFSCLDEDCVMPKTTDKSFTEKISSLWEKKSEKFKPSRLAQGFTLKHYAAEVEYTTEGWLEKNKDPLNDNVTQLLVESSEHLVKKLFSDEKAANEAAANSGARVKKGLFRTVAQRHKEQLTHLMAQLNSTHPHFVRCIVPNHEKRPHKFDNWLVLDQLRCNGVLEGIRIARTGYPNRLFFAEFRMRYEVLVKNMPKGYVEGQKACSIILSDLGLDPGLYKVGLTKVFFKSGVLAELEERREAMIREIIVRFQSLSRGFITRTRVTKELFKSQAASMLKKNFEIYLNLKDNPWWKLYVRMRPLLMASRESGENKLRDAAMKKLEANMKSIEEQKTQIEEDHRKTEQELERINKVLEGERLLALDKEEILKRARAKETDLEEQLSGALDDLDRLENQCDELLIAKRKTDEQSSIWKSELEQGAAIILSLEQEKKNLEARIVELEGKLKHLSDTKDSQESKWKKFEDEVSALSGKVVDKDRRVKELEATLRKSDEEVQRKLEEVNMKRDDVNLRVKQLTAENQEIRQQLDELTTTSTGFEELIAKKERELSAARKAAESHEKSAGLASSEREAIEKKHNSVQTELSRVLKDLSLLKERHVKAEQDVADSRKLLEAKISDSEKATESRRALDKQIEGLQRSLDDREELWNTERLKLRGEVDAKQSLIEELQSEVESLQDAKDSLNSLEAEKSKLLLEISTEKQKSSQLVTLKTEVKDLKAALELTNLSKQKTDASLDSLQRDLSDSRSKLRSIEKQHSDASLERERAFKDVESIKKQLQEANDRADKLKIQNDTITKELDDSRRENFGHEFEREKLEKDLANKNTQMEKLRASVKSEVEQRVSKLASEKAELEVSEKKLRQELEELNVEHETLKMQREKMIREIEDLQHDLSREQKSALSAIRLKDQVQQQYDSLKEANERQRRDRSEVEVSRRKLTSSLDDAKKELAERTDQLMALQRVLNPRSKEPMDWTSQNKETAKLVDLSKKLIESEKARKRAEEQRALVEAQMNDAKKRWSKDLDEKDSKYYASKRAILDDLAGVNNNAPSPPGSPRKPRPTSALYRSSYSMNPAPFSQRNSVHGHSVSSRSSDDYDKENKPEIDGKSTAELEEMFNSLQTSRNDLLAVYHETSKNLVNTKELLADVSKEKTRLERELYQFQMSTPKSDESNELSDLKLRLDTEQSRNSDLLASMKLYKGRSEEYYGRLESAEIVVLKASRAEEFAKTQLKELQETLSATKADYRQAEKTIMDLQSRLHSLEGEVEDKSIELHHAKESQERAQKELGYLSTRHSQEATASASSIEAMRSRYSEEIRSLSIELEKEKQKRSDTQRNAKKLERQIEVLKNSPSSPDLGSGASWATMKNQFETQIQELTKSNDESSLAYRDAQKRIGSLLSQVRTLRTTMDEISVDRNQLQKDKRTLEQRLSEVSQRFEELAVSEKKLNGSVRSVDGGEVQNLRASLQKQSEASTAILEQLKRTKDQLEQDRVAIEHERALNDELRAYNAESEREKNDLNLKIIDLEARLLGPSKADDSYLQQKVADLERRLAEQAQRFSEESRQMRSADRDVREMAHQLEQRDKLVARLQDESKRSDLRIARLTENLEDIQGSETSHRVAARRSEREARDAKERALRLEKELESWRSRFDDLTSNRQASFV